MYSTSFLSICKYVQFLRAYDLKASKLLTVNFVGNPLKLKVAKGVLNAHTRAQFSLVFLTRNRQKREIISNFLFSPT